MTDERRAFEDWFEADAMPLEHSCWFSRDADGDYEFDFVQDAWRGWKARAELAERETEPLREKAWRYDELCK